MTNTRPSDILKRAASSLIALGMAGLVNAEPGDGLGLNSLTQSENFSIIEASGDEWIRENIVLKLGDLKSFDVLLIEVESSSPYVIALSESNKEVVCYSKEMEAPKPEPVEVSKLQALIKESREIIDSNREKMMEVDKSEERSYCLLVRASKEGPYQWSRADIRNPPKDGRLARFIDSLEIFWRAIGEELAEPPSK